ncbi:MULTISPECIES: multidrug efflux SMR transporter [Rhodobacterales]|uniref:DMT family transporter n=1 Tax=Roseobacter sp. N2S TaxID=2663844 RepID=UPI00285B8031|nr:MULTISPECIES: multidrug efflux SMR transporter [Rhodobacterales]MDR6263630.1 multidrug transporter EmrE-like cation transporter [Roseobacter sp. N2S]
MMWVYLILAIAAEVVGTLSLKASDGLSKWSYVGLTVVSYAVSFYFLAIVLRSFPVGLAYAVWSGAGVAVVTVAGALLFGDRIDTAGFIGISMIVLGVLVINIFSNSVPH